MKGVMLGDKHSFRDFGVVLTEKNISFPEVKKDLIDIPGADGMLDLSTVLTDGEIKYYNRPIQLSFTVHKHYENWEGIKSQIANAVHGRVLNVIFDMDKGFFWRGRCELTSWEESGAIATLTVDVDADPYKYNVQTSDEKWKWDSFSFRTGVITNLSEVVISGERTISVPNTAMRVVPEFICSHEMQLIFEGVYYGLQAGAQKNLNILLKEGVNEMKFIGNGTVTIKYRGGTL